MDKRENEQLHYSFLDISLLRIAVSQESCGNVGKTEARLTFRDLVDYISLTCLLVPKEPSKHSQDQDIGAHSY